MKSDRVARLYDRLSAKERTLLVWRAIKAERRHDRKLRSTIPDAQAQEYDRLVGLIRGVNGDLACVILIEVQLVEQLSLRAAWLVSLHASALNATSLVSTALAKVPGRKERNALRRALKPRMARFAVRLAGDTGWRVETTPRVGEDLIAERLLADLQQTWPARWLEVRALEIVAEEVAQELDREDPLFPDVREQLDRCRLSLLELQQVLEPYTGSLSTDEPGDDLLEGLRNAVGLLDDR